MDSKTAVQIANAIERMNEGHRKIDLRGKTPQAKRFIRTFVLPCCKPMTPGLTIPEIPTEVLKVFLDRMIDSCGYNSVLIRQSPVWVALNIYPMGRKFHSASDIAEMEAFFIRLDVAGFIYFASAGTIWRIDPR